MTTLPVGLRGSSSRKTHLTRCLVAGEVLPHVVLGVVLGQGRARLEHEEGLQALAELLVVDADDGDLADGGVLLEELLDLPREDVLATGDDHLVVATVDEQQAVVVEVPDVAVAISPSTRSLPPPPV